MESYAENEQAVVRVPLAGRDSRSFASLRLTRVEELAPCDAAGILDGSSDLTGLMLWPAAEALAELIAAEPDKWRGKSVLELGAGVGLVGLVASLFCSRVMITDGEEEVVSVIDQNIRANQNVLPDPSLVRCCRLDWSEDLTSWQEQHECPPFDIVLGSDIIYSLDSLQPLFTVVDSFLTHTPNAHFTVLYGSRGRKLDDRLPEVAAANGFNVSTTLHRPSRAAPDSEPMRLCTFTRRYT